MAEELTVRGAALSRLTWKPKNVRHENLRWYRNRKCIYYLRFSHTLTMYRDDGTNAFAFLSKTNKSKTHKFGKKTKIYLRLYWFTIKSKLRERESCSAHINQACVAMKMNQNPMTKYRSTHTHTLFMMSKNGVPKVHTSHTFYAVV